MTQSIRVVPQTGRPYKGENAVSTTMTGTTGVDVRAISDPAASEVERIAGSSQFRQLVHERTRFGWLLTAAMLVVYYGFIGLIAFAHDLMATRIGGTASLGLYLGVAVILIAFALTGIYVARANSRYDTLAAELKRSLAR